jgi:4-amino-4-deoxy-L-arabinose transferase-like glycosyltransferase
MQRLILLIGCALLFCVWFSRMPLVEVDETRYVSASRNMLEQHDFIIPWYNGQPRYEKPVMIYWIQSASMQLFGKNEFAARLPSGILGILLVLLVHGFLLRWMTRRLPNEQATARGAAFLGAVALATLPLFTIDTRVGVTDVTLTLFMSLAMLGLLEADLTRRQTDDRAEHGRWWYLLAAAGCGLAFLTKGPIALLVPGLTWLSITCGREH